MRPSKVLCRQRGITCSAPSVASASVARAARCRRASGRQAPHAAREQLAAPWTPPALDHSLIEPYIIRERVTTLTASWDPREHDEEAFAGLEAQLLRSGAHSVELWQAPGVGGRAGQVRLSVTCSAEPAVGDDLAAMVLELTAATDVKLANELRCGLPQEEIAVDTPWGPVRVVMSLRGSELFKASPDWAECGTVARAAAGRAPGGEAPAPEAVAAAALQALAEGLEDGSISLGAQYLF